MDDMTYGGAGYDYRQNQRLWQRVAPSMPPYPESAWPPAAGGGMAGAAGTEQKIPPTRRVFVECLAFFPFLC